MIWLERRQAASSHALQQETPTRTIAFSLMALTGYHMLEGDASDKSVLVADMNMSIQNLLTARGDGLAPSFAMSFTAVGRESHITR